MFSRFRSDLVRCFSDLFAMVLWPFIMAGAAFMLVVHVRLLPPWQTSRSLWVPAAFALVVALVTHFDVAKRGNVQRSTSRLLLRYIIRSLIILVGSIAFGIVLSWVGVVTERPATIWTASNVALAANGLGAFVFYWFSIMRLARPDIDPTLGLTPIRGRGLEAANVVEARSLEDW